MTWTECPRCQGEVGDWCGGQCHEGGLYICEACGHVEEDQHEQCPTCGDLDVYVRIARLKEEAEEGSTEAAANLFALQSGAKRPAKNAHTATNRSRLAMTKISSSGKGGNSAATSAAPAPAWKR